MRLSVVGALAVALGVAVPVLGHGQAAEAASPYRWSKCTVGSSGWCSTAVIPQVNHYLHYTVDASRNQVPKGCTGPTTWFVQDVKNLVSVRRGTVAPGGSASGGLYGLYGQYRLTLVAPHCKGAVGRLTNHPYIG